MTLRLPESVISKCGKPLVVTAPAAVVPKSMLKSVVLVASPVPATETASTPSFCNSLRLVLARFALVASLTVTVPWIFCSEFLFVVRSVASTSNVTPFARTTPSILGLEAIASAAALGTLVTVTCASAKLEILAKLAL